MVSMSSPPAIFGFQHQKYSYKSLAIPIPHDAGLAPFHPDGDRMRGSKGPFIDYVRVPKEGGGLEKSLHTLTLAKPILT